MGILLFPAMSVILVHGNCMDAHIQAGFHHFGGWYSFEWCHWNAAYTALSGEGRALRACDSHQANRVCTHMHKDPEPFIAQIITTCASECSSSILLPSATLPVPCAHFCLQEHLLCSQPE